MPILDGFSAAKEIKRVAASIPILILTFEKNETLARLANNVGVTGYFTKGESSDALLTAIDAAIGGQTVEISDCSSVAGKEGSPQSRVESTGKPLLRCPPSSQPYRFNRTLSAELEDQQFEIETDVALTSGECAERLRSRHYDVVLAEYPIPKWQQEETASLLRRIDRNIPLIFITHTMDREAVADLITRGAFDCVEMDNLGHLPIAIRRALKENNLRGERNRVEKKLQHSEAHYRALMGNLAFGICRCGMQGQFVDVNRALVTMLGYASKEELLGLNLYS